MKKTSTKRSELLETLLSFRHAFVVLGVFSFFINLLMLVPTIYMLQVYDRVLASRNELTLLMLTVMMLGAYLLMEALEFSRSFILIRVGSKLDEKLNNRIFTAAFEANLKAPGSNAGQSLQDLTVVRQFLTGNGLFAFFDAPWFPIYFAVIYLFVPALAIFALCGAIVLFGLAYLMEKVSHGPLTEANKMHIGATNFATNNLRNAEVIEAMGMLPNLQSRWRQRHLKFLQLQSVASDRAATISAISKFVQISMQSLILGAGALYTLDGTITPGGMIASSILMGRMLAPVQLAIGTWKQLIAARDSWGRLESLLGSFPERVTGMSLPKPSGQVVVENVVAGAPGSNVQIIKGAAFTIQAGEVVAVVGPSGSGKSTLARLLVGVWGTMAGKVRLDGADVHTWNKAELGPSMGYLPQDIELFDGTIAENICRFGEIDSEKAIEAAQRAGVHEMILQLPQGYNTLIGANSGALSGGQRQRVALARAMYDNPSLLVLDEPNSNLDDVGEAALVKAVMDLKAHGKTVVVISHRMSILSAVDKVLVMRDGTVAMYGPRDQVLAALAQNAQQAPQASQPPQAPAQLTAPANAATSQ